ncbi:uncharacterized protein LOC129765913 [Toxorhynchites rutilus septentrionalis]|uniref:uncharacterized protein LOC129765913 n=1 Tax=Toxorhynchites rutilus septentrionalis TaxID=329112 RepID=UPI00247907F3|nr:uncharacterized protein LOC129765913 [Toxorhynchites rutilus septentrionalis]
MPTNYKRKSNRQSWTAQQLEQAIKAVKSGSPVKTAARSYAIPRSTLIRHLTSSTVSTRLGPIDSVFNSQQEEELVKHLLDLEKKFYGITMTNVRKLAFDLAEKNGLPHPFNKSTKIAGKAWLSNFLKRNPKLSFRKPEATSAARARGFNKPAVSAFYDLLEEALKDPKLTPDRVLNADETSVCTVPPKKSKVAALKGKKQLGGITSAERGETATAVMCMSATEQHRPPFFIFLRMRMHEALKKGASRGSKFACNASGYMTVEIFNEWFDHFLEHVKPSEDSPALLIIDGHSSHTKNLAFTEKARANFVKVLVLPPHTSNKLQPLDVSFMASFKTYYAQEVERFLQQNPGIVVSQYDVAELMKPAFIKAATTEIAENGFEKTGIWPFDRNIFSDDDFAPATVTDQPDPEVLREEETFRLHLEGAPSQSTVNRISCEDKEVQVLPEDIMADFAEPDSISTANNPVFEISPSIILPLPKKVTPRENAKQKRQLT